MDHPGSMIIVSPPPLKMAPFFPRMRGNRGGGLEKKLKKAVSGKDLGSG